MCNLIDLYQYGEKDSLLRQAWDQGQSQITDEEINDTPPPAIQGETANTAESDRLLPPVTDGITSGLDTEQYEVNAQFIIIFDDHHSFHHNKSGFVSDRRFVRSYVPVFSSLSRGKGG